MIRNYFISAYRGLLKNKFFSILNLFGLSIGITASIFILQYVFFEMSYDSFNSNHKSIYRVMNDRYQGEKLIQSGQITYSAVGPQMAQDYPEIINHTTIDSDNDNKIRIGDRVVKLDLGFYVQPSFFELFDYELIAGDRKTLVSDLHSVVFTQSTIRRIFEYKENDFDQFIGKLILVNRYETPYKITGILKDIPANSHLEFEMLTSRITLEKYWPQAKYDWKSSNFFHYVQLTNNADRKLLELKFADFSKKYFRGDQVTGNTEKFHLQPLDDVHLYSNYEYELADIGNGTMVWLLLCIAIFILMMAWINYINLATSRSLERAKEVGIRKVIGANKEQLTRQFMTETILVNSIAVVTAFTLIQMFQGSFNRLIEKNLDLSILLSSTFNSVPMALIIILILVVGTFLSGIYPALILSAYSPSETLKGKIAGTSKGAILRKGLIIFQFAISTILIAGTLLVYQQVDFMRDQELGMDMDQVSVISGPSLTNFDSTFVERIKSFKDALLKNSDILHVGTSTRVFGERLPRTFNVTSEISDQSYMLNRIHADFGFLNTYKIQLEAGRGLEYRDHNFDGRSVKNVLLNKSACNLLGFKSPKDAVNMKLRFWEREWFVVGVTKDFHNRSLKQSIEPILIVPFYSVANDNYNIRLSGNHVKETMRYVESTFNEFFPGNVFEYYFMSDRFTQQYKNDQLFGKIFNLFSILAILIACLGLFGLVGYTAIRRTKEIGIRKVLGASMRDIFILLSTSFVRLVILSNLIVLPIIYLGAKAWLANYAFPISIGAWLFILPAASVVIISFCIISFQTLKTAQKNPVESLKID